MILTAKPGKSTMIQTVKKEYVSIDEAEEDLRNNFHEALNSDKRGIHLIKAQTGIGKTNLYLNLLKQTSDSFLIAVPTHRLKMEIYHKACAMGIDNISYTPELPEFSSDLQDRIKHAYDIGAGEYTITILRKAVQELKPDDPDYILLRNYLDAIDRLKEFRGHIITTHERFILMRTQNTLIEKREIIIDEDIMRTILSTYTVSNDDIFKAIKSGLFTGKAENRLKEIITSEGYQRYDFDSKPKFEMTNYLLHKLENTHGNIIDLVESNYVYRGKTETTFLKRKWLPKEKVVVLSATANEEVYRMLTQYNIHYYSCKKVEYMGKLKLYSKYSFSRYALNHQEGIIEYIKDRIDNDIVITFKQFEKLFHTKYHYGAIEGLNCLAGKNISIVGLPNINDFVYKLYGMAAGLNVDNSIMRSMRIEYNGYSFEINTFESSKLRTIQLWMLESFIEQAVGRARLLRNHCTVKVFARFPVEQAIVE
jgi:hypothetical protein